MIYIIALESKGPKKNGTYALSILRRGYEVEKNASDVLENYVMGLNKKLLSRKLFQLYFVKMTTVIPSWLNDKFVEKALRNSEGDETLSVRKISIGPATAKGDNYLSDMYRVKAEYSQYFGDKMVDKKRSIIVKIALPSEGGDNEFAEKNSLFDTEIDMMTSTLIEMEKLLNDTKLAANCLYAQHEGPPLLVLEDLTPLGFMLANREACLNLQHCLRALRELAKFHATSVAVCEKNPEIKERYNEGLFQVNATGDLSCYFTQTIKCLSKLVATWPEFDQQFADKIMKLSDIAYEKAAGIMKVKESEFNVINHGDFWTNNMLFRYDEQSHLTGYAFVDFQHSFYASPAFDLTYFFCTSPTEIVLVNHQHDLINEYHQHLCKTMKEIHCKTQAPTLSELRNSLKDSEFFGFVVSSTILPFVFVKKSEAQSFEEIMGDDGSCMNNKGLHTQEYRITMTRRLLQWKKSGLLNV